ncbi:hypothetical protein L249_0785 [Ophiocordyceps polyrhachis-furcata BCC 54312]|uniref:Uncharacterized protein n=1 Tax=Ophiocordyceps polyrhachis-furcata BCC 54312 TaxID=1330021 RepID=A0A367LE11_9HYPO|nr:hypothetical protein L249_0785 [Ophiocordyceps polyrhachis-furcata BCC 54312]
MRGGGEELLTKDIWFLSMVLLYHSICLLAPWTSSPNNCRGIVDNGIICVSPALTTASCLYEWLRQGCDEEFTYLYGVVHSIRYTKTMLLFLHTIPLGENIRVGSFEFRADYQESNSLFPGLAKRMPSLQFPCASLQESFGIPPRFDNQSITRCVLEIAGPTLACKVIFTAYCKGMDQQMSRAGPVLRDDHVTKKAKDDCLACSRMVENIDCAAGRRAFVYPVCCLSKLSADLPSYLSLRDWQI